MNQARRKTLDGEKERLKRARYVTLSGEGRKKRLFRERGGKISAASAGGRSGGLKRTTPVPRMNSWKGDTRDFFIHHEDEGEIKDSPEKTKSLQKCLGK